ncbi:NUDIX hydrolase [Streptomyces marianii]|uniref:NUDIX hydrolase n=1 Tax=Streptomyces marianii TaxID=1817406 RepID=A0A5R9EBY4_9ACTN|nr:hypothetical protein [Streptomyces marianii]TLQ46359.1 hypothetical protein FEF34_28255 [Streptomyces marianii]
MTHPPPPRTAALRPVLIDPPRRRFLLHPAVINGRACWSVPMVRMRPGDTCRRAAVRHLRRNLGLPPLRIAPVIGRIRATGADGPERFVVLVAPALAWPADVRVLLHPDARWWTVAQIRASQTPLDPPPLIDLIDGYWDGWLPDGPITLGD